MTRYAVTRPVTRARTEGHYDGYQAALRDLIREFVAGGERAVLTWIKENADAVEVKSAARVCLKEMEA